MWWSTSVGLITFGFLFRISVELIEYYHLLSGALESASDLDNAGFIGNFRDHFAEYSIPLLIFAWCLIPRAWNFVSKLFKKDDSKVYPLLASVLLAITIDTLASVFERLIGPYPLTISSSATIYKWFLQYGALGSAAVLSALLLVRLGRRRCGWLVAFSVTIAVCADFAFGTRYFYNHQKSFSLKYAKAAPSASLERRIRELANRTGYKLEGRMVWADFPEIHITYRGMFGYGILLIPKVEFFSEDEVVAKVALEMGRWAHGGYLPGYLLRNLLFAVQMFLFWRLLHSSEYFLDQGFTKDDIIEEKSRYKQAALLILKALMVYY